MCFVTVKTVSLQNTCFNFHHSISPILLMQVNVMINKNINGLSMEEVIRVYVLKKHKLPRYTCSSNSMYIVLVH